MLGYILLVFCIVFNKFLNAHDCPGNEYNTLQQNATSSCFIWGDHIKTFDDLGINFKSKCTFTAVSLKLNDEDFIIDIGSDRNSAVMIKILYRNENYQLGMDDIGIPAFTTQQGVRSIPYESNHMRVYQPGTRIIVDFLGTGIEMKWDENAIVQITIQNDKKYDVLGLCGNNDKCSTNEFKLKNHALTDNLEQFLQEYQIDKMSCRDVPQLILPCGGNSFRYNSGNRECSDVLYGRNFHEAQRILNPKLYIESCIWDHCSCNKANVQECLCDSFDVYAKASISAGIKKIDWRDSYTCGKRCSGDLMFYSCAPEGGVRECGSNTPSNNAEICEEGCYCPPNTYLFKGRCYIQKNCPCSFMGREYQSGESFNNECNTCRCFNGMFTCTSKTCYREACTFGDPHYKTWDGNKYDFMGQCAYYLVKHKLFSISADHFVLKDGKFVKDDSNSPTYTRRVIIKMSNQMIELKPNFVTTINGQLVRKFPSKSDGMVITKPSSMFVLVELPNKVLVKWDGYSTVCIKIPTTMKAKVSGLFGTYTDDRNDDFLTPTGKIVSNANEFGNSWKTEDSCSDTPLDGIPHPCDVNPSAKRQAISICSAVNSEIFESCQLEDVDVYYDNCVYDTCLCNDDPGRCACDIIAAFADGCAQQNLTVNWRKRISECSITCPNGQEYQECANPCSRTCEDLSIRTECQPFCIEGCNCPVGKTLDENGKCIAISQCKCKIENIYYPPGYQLLDNDELLLTCKNARWIETIPTQKQKKNVKTTQKLNERCDAKSYSIYTPCMPETLLTCQNMHQYIEASTRICNEGCQCMEGYVLDIKKRKCVVPDDCPCFIDGRSYGEGDSVKEGCETCICQNGEMVCNDDNCKTAECFEEDNSKTDEYGKCVCKNGTWKCVDGQCDIWGNSHVKTFDDYYYDFQGVCSYILAHGSIEDDNFLIDFQNEKCTKEGATCLKSFTVTVNIGGVEETLTLQKKNELPNTKNLHNLKLIDRVLYIRIDVIKLGIEVFWDQNTWLYVRLNPKWQGKVQGLCANYDRRKEDDEKLSAKLWEMNDNCNSGQPAKETCDKDKVRWAEHKCGILLGPKFKSCHNLLPVDKYYKACLVDSCSCDLNGDCESLCTAIATYAQKCNNYGLPINWRSQSFCPIECTGHNTYYESCVSNCPPKTCDNLRTYKCEDYSCREGCVPKILPAGYVYTDDSYGKIVLESACEQRKCSFNGTIYYHGEIMNIIKNCFVCYCNDGSTICENVKCDENITPPTTSTCDKSKCLKLNCPSNSVEYVLPGQCCPSCQGKDQCIISTPTGFTTKNPGEIWTENRCKECTCMGNTPYEYCVQCKNKICTRITDRYSVVDEIQYIFEQGQCCKTMIPIQCVHNQKYYRIGEEWTVDQCTSMKCVADPSTGAVTKIVIAETCNKDCPIGYGYQTFERSCCGKCLQNSCIFEGKAKTATEVWYSEDGCTSYTCYNAYGIYRVIASETRCPEIQDCSGDIKKKGCCNYCSTSELFSWQEDPEYSCIGRLNF